MAKDLTTGSVLGTIAGFSLPYFLSYFLQTLYGTADLFIIGLYCQADATTAVAGGSQIMHMVTVMIVGLAMGSTVLIGWAVGAKDPYKQSRTIGNTITLFAVTSLVAMAVLLLATTPIVAVMQTPTEAVEGTTVYLWITFAGIPLITAYNVIAAIFRGLGDTKSPLLFVFVACLFNIGLDFLFIGTFQMGPAGAAFGTVISQSISVIVAVWYVRRRHLIPPLTTEDLKPDKATIADVLGIGVPISLQDGFIQVAFLLITVFANMRGLPDAAAVGIVEKLISLFFLVPSSMLSATSALCAQNKGAGKHDRAITTLRYTTIISVTYGFVVALAMQFVAEPTVALFTKDAQVVVLGAQYLQAYSWDTILASVHFCFSGYFCAYGLSTISFAHNCLSALLFRIPLSYWASVTFPASLFPMGLAAPAGSLFSIVFCVIAFGWMLKHQKHLS